MDKHNAFIPKNTANTIQVPGMALRSNAGFPTPSDSHKEAIFFDD